MITLKTLELSTAQQIFDHVGEHLLTQRKKSRDTEGCLYRTSDGLKCAAGCLIADDEYVAKIEGLDWYGTIDILNITSQHASLISRLQDIHDGYPPSYWFKELEYLANEKGYSMEALKQFKNK